VCTSARCRADLASLSRIEEDIAAMRTAMAEASRAVLGGFELGTDAAAVLYPNRYMDPRGQIMWERVTKLLPPSDRGQARKIA
jgi:hypothetical protein